MNLLKRTYYKSALYAWSLRRRRAFGISGAAPDPAAGDAMLGAGILHGRFPLAGQLIETADAIWDRDMPSRAAALALHRFGWLRHLRPLGPGRPRELAAELVSAWLSRHTRWAADSWESGTLARRLTHWLQNDDLVAPGMNQETRRLHIDSIATQTNHLIRQPLSPLPATDALAEGLALILAAVYVNGLQDYMNPGLDRFERLLARDILPDGGHRSRNPDRAAAALADILAAKQAAGMVMRSPPAFLQVYEDRLVACLKGLRLGDGRLGAFNGGGGEDPASLQRLLDMADAKGQASVSAPHMGYQVLKGGRTRVMADTGALGPDQTCAHAGPLSFEMSVGRRKLVGNCGHDADPSTPWAGAFSATAAHSTATVRDRNAFDLDLPAANNERVTWRRNDKDGSAFLQGSHSGYLVRFGVTHNRDLYLASNGTDFRGKDEIIGPGGVPFTIRFHLHPDVRAARLEGGKAVLLRLPPGGQGGGHGGGQGWRFRTSASALTLEESVYQSGFATTRRRTLQIVIDGETGPESGRIKWSFQREG